MISAYFELIHYAKDQDYDGQTQCTEQTMTPSATVRAEYTASKFTEDSYLFSASITSTPAEKHICFNKFFLQHKILLLNIPQTLGSICQHLNNNNFFQPVQISINSTKTETHIYTNINEILLPHYTLLLT